MAILLILLAVLAVTAASIAVFHGTRQARSSTKDRLGLSSSVASTLLAVVALVVSGIQLSQGGGTEQNVRGNGNVTVQGDTGGGICAFVEGDCPNDLPEPDTLAQMPVEDAQAKLRAIPGSTSKPPGSAPWIFLVLATSEQGVFFRDGHEVNDHRLPGEPVVRDGRPVYVDCRVTDAWVADPAAPNKAALDTWYKVRYPEPADAGQYYLYGGYLFPVGHDGAVPTC